jgi:hypothetical protein
MLLNIVATFHFANTIRICVASVFSTQRHTPTSAVTSLISVMNRNKQWNQFQTNNSEIMVLRFSMILFYLHSFMNLIATLFFTLPKMFPAIEKPIAKMCVWIQSSLLLGHIYIVFDSWTTV